jgi:hypothetical protein
MAELYWVKATIGVGYEDGRFYASSLRRLLTGRENRVLSRALYGVTRVAANDEKFEGE